MSFATPADMRQALPQLDATITDATLQVYLDRANSVLVEALEAYEDLPSLDYSGYTTETKPIYAPNLPYVVLPPYRAGSITKITADAAGMYEVVGYSERDAAIWVGSKWSYMSNDGTGNIYVTADWGLGTPPQALIEAEVEVAVRMFRGRDAGFSDVIGTQGGVGYNGKLPNLVTFILDTQKAKNKQKRDIVV